MNNNRALKALVIGMAILAAILLAVFIFVPSKKTEAPTGAVNGNGTAASGSISGTVSGTPSIPPDASGLYSYTSLRGKVIKISIASDQKIVSPLRITGNVPAGWAFEASFPVEIRDAAEVVRGRNPASVPNWQSPTGAWFGATISFTAPVPGMKIGTLILKKDNPSGLPQNEDELRIPITF